MVHWETCCSDFYNPDPPAPLPPPPSENYGRNQWNPFFADDVEIAYDEVWANALARRARRFPAAYRAYCKCISSDGNKEFEWGPGIGSLLAGPSPQRGDFPLRVVSRQAAPGDSEPSSESK